MLLEISVYNDSYFLSINKGQNVWNVFIRLVPISTAILINFDGSGAGYQL